MKKPTLHTDDTLRLYAVQLRTERGDTIEGLARTLKGTPCERTSRQIRRMERGGYPDTALAIIEHYTGATFERLYRVEA